MDTEGGKRGNKEFDRFMVTAVAGDLGRHLPARLEAGVHMDVQSDFRFATRWAGRQAGPKVIFLPKDTRSCSLASEGRPHLFPILLDTYEEM